MTETVYAGGVPNGTLERIFLTGTPIGNFDADTISTAIRSGLVSKKDEAVEQYRSSWPGRTPTYIYTITRELIETPVEVPKPTYANLAAAVAAIGAARIAESADKDLLKSINELKSINDVIPDLPKPKRVRKPKKRYLLIKEALGRLENRNDKFGQTTVCDMLAMTNTYAGIPYIAARKLAYRLMPTDRSGHSNYFNEMPKAQVQSYLEQMLRMAR